MGKIKSYPWFFSFTDVIFNSFLTAIVVCGPQLRGTFTLGGFSNLIGWITCSFSHLLIEVSLDGISVVCPMMMHAYLLFISLNRYYACSVTEMIKMFHNVASFDRGISGWQVSVPVLLITWSRRDRLNGGSEDESERLLRFRLRLRVTMKVNNTKTVIYYTYNVNISFKMFVLSSCYFLLHSLHSFHSLQGCFMSRWSMNSKLSIQCFWEFFNLFTT